MSSNNSRYKLADAGLMVYVDDVSYSAPSIKVANNLLLIMWLQAMKSKSHDKMQFQGEEMIYQQTTQLLDTLRIELQQLEFWSAVSPSTQALKSSAPFCCDMMPLHSWLQFIFIPKMQHLIANQQPLPSKIAIAPFAEVAYAKDSHRTRNLIAILIAIDLLLSTQDARERH